MKSKRYLRSKRTKRRSFLPFSVVLVLFALLLSFLWLAWQVMGIKVRVNQSGDQIIYISTGTDYDGLQKVLIDEGLVQDKLIFRLLAKQMNLTKHVYPGKYAIPANTSYFLLISKLRSGSDEDVKVILNRFRSLSELCSVVGKSLECDSAQIAEALKQAHWALDVSIEPENIMLLFLPDTYFFKWDTDADEFLKRMQTEYKNFWNEERFSKAKALGLTPSEVGVLASIIQEESNKTDELPKIAGVYLNRLRKGMLLQADPTLKFAAGDWSIKRLLDKHKKIESPYNTYLHAGLPPGPIGLPQKRAIEAVLNAENHNYFYFCAKDDMSGYHHFSTNYNQHLNYARAYQRKLNQLKIR